MFNDLVLIVYKYFKFFSEESKVRIYKCVIASIFIYKNTQIKILRKVLSKKGGMKYALWNRTHNGLSQ